MDVLTEDPTFPSVSDSDLGIDNDALTINFDLEEFINENVCMPEEAIPAIAYSHPSHHGGGNGFRIHNLHLRGLEQPVPQQQQQQQPTGPQPNSLPGGHQPSSLAGHQPQPHQAQVSCGGGSLYSCSQQQQQQQQQPLSINNAQTSLPYMVHTLPDSPPDSEPYSPPDGHPNSHMNGHTNGHPNSLQNTHDNSKFTLTSSPPTSMHSHMYPPHHRPPGGPGPMSQAAKPPPVVPPVVSMPGYHENPLLNLPPASHQPQLPPSTQIPLNVPQAQVAASNLNAQILNNPGNLSPQSKKRKHMESPPGLPGPLFAGRNGLVPNIKQEPTGGYNNSSYMPDCDDEYSNYDPDSSNSYGDNGVYQVIKWQTYTPNKWAVLTDANLKDLPAPQFRVDADKGFNFSISDESFVCQKKNHFQITSHVGISGDPKYVRTPEGVKKIDHYCIHFYGVKLESQNQSIKIEQSQSDRSKKPYVPARVDIYPDQVSKMTVGRLHFSETTSNNMRKKGRPNPDQRYFILIVSLSAHSGDNSYMIAASQSEKIIVRASNPGQFDSDVDGSHWQKGQTPDSVYHVGRVGVNTDHPDEALSVQGNIRVAGQILHTSDVRAKEIIREVPSKEQLKKVADLKIYDYKFSDDYAEHVGMAEDRRTDTGVIAQEIKDVLPDAVIETGDVKFENGKEINNLLVVNKDRIYMENVGAVKELCKLTDNLEVRIDELEKMNSKLSKLKRFDSLKSTVSSKSAGSNSTVSSSIRKSQRGHHHKSRSSPPPPPSNSGWCSNRFIQMTIIILICIMAFCLIAITTLYILERQKDDSGHTVINNHFNGKHGGGNSSIPPPTPGPPEPHNVPTGSGSNASTRAPTPIVIVPTSRPAAPPTIESLCTMSQCEKWCCDTSSDSGDGDIISRFLDDIRARKMAAHPTYQVFTEPPSQRQQRTTEENKIQVIINPNSVLLDPGKAPAGTFPDGGPYRKKRSAGDAFPATIAMPDLNFTLSDVYRDPAYSMLNNNTYRLPYSMYFMRENYTLTFSVGDNSEVHLCSWNPEQSCDDPGTGPEQSFTPGTGSQWNIAFGLYKSSIFSFRVSRSNMPGACNQTDFSEGTFTDYNLIFARKCL